MATPALDPAAVTRLCEGDVFPTPTDLDCTDAIAVALGEVADQSGVVARVEIRWQLICEEGPCGTPTRDAAQAIIRYVGGRALGVVIRRGDSGVITSEGPQAISISALGSPPPFVAPPDGLASVANPPSEVAARAPAPLCGAETAGLAGPFDSRSRSCFLAAVLNSMPAEFLSLRADVEGLPFTELWRYDGRGPLVVYLSGPGGWSKLNCALLLVNDDRQLIDHTDCVETPVT